MGVRCFVALELSEETLGALVRFREELVRSQPDWAAEKWARRENLHVTLKFLGSLEEGTLQAVTAALTGVAAGAAPFTMTLSGARAVPSPRRASMLWATFEDGTRDCARLAGDIDEALALLGLDAEERAFKAHVTLARARRPRRVDPEALQAAWHDALTCGAGSTNIVSVRCVTLFSSRLGKGGPVYSAISRHEFRDR